MDQQTPITTTAIPTIDEFNPWYINSQIQTIKLIRKEYDYSRGALELLLSGSVGSAKSLVVAHIAATHALMNPGAGVLLGRRTLKDLKNTLWSILLRHCPVFYNHWNKADMTIKLPNGSIIYGVSWDDGRYDKFRSYELSMAAIEELTENRTQEIYDEIHMRIGRAIGVKENIFICPTNPDSPSHWAHEYFINKPTYSRRVIYSKTSDNPFLPNWYIPKLKENLDPKMAKRMLYGQWIEIHKDQVYYNFNEELNYKDQLYEWDEHYPICIMHDFNIGKGKPMSAAAGQFIDGVFHVGHAYLVEGARTADILEDMADSGIFDQSNNQVWVYGDATGRNNDTRSIRDDYDIIIKYVQNYQRSDSRPVEVLNCVPTKNPPLRRRHNVVNAHFLNDNDQVRFFIYKNAKDCVKGFRLTEYKDSANLIEDDSLREQHVTTAIGYWIDYTINKQGAAKSRAIQL